MLRRRALWMAVGALALSPGCSCGGSRAGADASLREDGSASADGAAGPDAALPLIWIDFTITGCGGAGGAGAEGATPDAGPGEEPCHGAAPLALGFIPIAPAPVEVYEWRFEGDGSDPDSRATPDHVFAEPGIYDVSLNAQGPGGTANALKKGIVVVEPAPIGAPCDGDLQCASGTCLCGGGACEGLATGFCSAPCAGSCDEGVCADLGPTDPGAPEPWQDQLCLAGCEDTACPAGSECSELLAGGGGGWVLACFPPGPLAAIGASCALPTGELDDELCASGDCVAEGLRGLCGGSCGPGNRCPPSAACATFEGGPPGPTCLARCDGFAACDGDPWLACQAPGGTGALSFTVDEPVSPGGYCAPKACSNDPECPQGQCSGGFCGP
jgi:PKD repeat protein